MASGNPDDPDYEEEQPSTSGKADFPQPPENTPRPLDPLMIAMERRGPIGHEVAYDPFAPEAPAPAWMQGRYPGRHPTMSPNVTVDPTRGPDPDISDQIAKLLVPQLRDKGARQSLKSMALNEGVNAGAQERAEDPMMGAAYFGPHTPLSAQLGSRYLDAIAQIMSMPDFSRDQALRGDEFDMRMAMRIKQLPDYIQKQIKASNSDAAELLAKKTIDRAGERDLTK